jgi:hypothetical protein
MALGVAQGASARDGAASAATLVIYRADESVKSKRLNFDVQMDRGSLGRLKAGNAIVVTRPAGQYALDTSITGTQGVVVEMKPGQTHYVHTEMDVRGTRVKVRMVEVEEQVARRQVPAIDQAI